MRDRRFSPKSLLSVVLVSILFLALGAPGAFPAASDSPGPTGALDRSGTNDPPTTVWLDADGEPLPFATSAEVRRFLRDAEVISVEAVLKGVTQSKKLLLELDGVRAHAIFRDVDVDEIWVKLSDGSFHMRLSDQDRHEVAAYEMALLLGLDNVPPTVIRRVGPKTGSLQLWLENVISDGRLEGGLRPPDYAAFAEQLQAMELFDYLILNIDRHTGNYLIDADWKLWMIDHTRAFQVTETVPSPEGLGRAERLVWDRVLAFDETVIEETFERLLTPIERASLLQRIDRLQAHIGDLIVKRGINAVIF